MPGAAKAMTEAIELANLARDRLIVAVGRCKRMPIGYGPKEKDHKAGYGNKATERATPYRHLYRESALGSIVRPEGTLTDQARSFERRAQLSFTLRPRLVQLAYRQTNRMSMLAIRSD